MWKKHICAKIWTLSKMYTWNVALGPLVRFLNTPLIVHSQQKQMMRVSERISDVVESFNLVQGRPGAYWGGGGVGGEKYLY